MSSTLGRLSNLKRSAVKSPNTDAVYKDCCSLPTFHTATGNQATQTPRWQGNKFLNSTISSFFFSALSLLFLRLPSLPLPLPSNLSGNLRGVLRYLSRQKNKYNLNGVPHIALASNHTRAINSVLKVQFYLLLLHFKLWPTVVSLN